MACPDQTLQKLIEGSEPITREIAQELAQALGTSPEFWVNLEGNYLSMAPPRSSIVDDWAHEGPDDPQGDRLLLAEALAESERYCANPQEHQAWEAFKAELKEAEAAGELPE
jgi:hypothetical protein